MFATGTHFASFYRKEEFMKSLLLGILMIIAIPLPLQGQSATDESDHSLSVVFSSNLNGEVEPCG